MPELVIYNMCEEYEDTKIQTSLNNNLIHNEYPSESQKQKRGMRIVKECPSCHKQFETLKSRNKKYCSKQCEHEKLELYTTYYCDVCGKEMTIKKSRYQKLLDGKQKTLTCSMECANQLKQTGADIICDNCGKSFHRRQDHIDRNNKHNFCCRQCNYEYTKRNSHEYRQCEICGKEFYCLKSSSQRFCSNKCNSEWQKTVTGINNPLYKRIEVECDYCHNKFDIPQSKIGAHKHKFCSMNCKREWFKNVLCKDEQYKQDRRNTALLELQNGVFNTVDTKPQLIVNKILDELKIEYEREKILGFYSMDNYLPEYNLVIEIQGDYWHCNPKKYDTPINNIQCKTISRDKAKHTYLKKYYGIEILYLWESDINKYPELCKQLIVEYITNNGILKDYHSMNYLFKNNTIELQPTLIIPHQNRNLLSE